MPTPPLSIPPELKKITQFVRRAEELDRDIKRPESRLVAYYCRQHAVQIGISLSKSAAATTCLSQILNDLESEKKTMSVFSKEESRLICRKFAMEVFDKADSQDRAGTSNKGTAKIFYAAAVFLEMLQHFGEKRVGDSEEGEDDDDGKSELEIEEDKKRIYSKWKATEILKAIKEGREITPGGYQDNAPDLQEADESNHSENNDKEKIEDGNGNQPAESNVKDDQDLGIPPPAPTSFISATDSTPNDGSNKTDSDNDDDDDDNGNVPSNQGTEVDLYGPPSDPPPPPSLPPPYNPPSFDTETTKQDISRPPMPSPLPPPPSSAPPAPKPRSSMFGRNKSKKSKKASKVVIADAMELTRFAMAALEASDVDLASTRLQQALNVLNK